MKKNNMKIFYLSLMAFRCFGAHFRVPMKDHEKNYHKSDKSQKVLIGKRQIMKIFMFVKKIAVAHIWDAGTESVNMAKFSKMNHIV
jgi:hypothetical protein